MVEYNKGDRVQLHPATDDWARGDRYGQIVAVPRARDRFQRYEILMDRSNRVRRHAAGNILEVIGRGDQS